MNDLAPLAVAVPLAVAALLAALHTRLPRRARDAAAIAAALAVAILCGWLLSEALAGPVVYWFGGWWPRDGIALGIGFAIGPLGAGLALLAAVLMTASFMFSWRYFDDAGALYEALQLVFLGAMVGFCLTGDLFNLFVFFELMSVAAYARTGYKIEEEPALMGAFNFAVTNSVGAFLVLTGIALVYGRTGALNLAQAGAALAGQHADSLVLAAFVLLVAGYGIKAALVPFQFWLADAHAVAPSPVCVLFSGVMVELGLYAVLRVYWTVFAGVPGLDGPGVRDVWLGIGVATALVGGIMCLAQRHLKRMLAFSTISHTGVFLVGGALLDARSLAGTALYVVGHGLAKGALFLGTGILLNRFGSVDENQLHRKGRRFPGLGVLFLVGGLALAGLPPFSAYLGKGLIEEAYGHAGSAWVGAVLLVSSALTGGAVLRATGGIFLGLGPRQDQGAGTPSRQKKETDEDYDHPPMVMWVPAAVLLAGALVVGLWPGILEGTEQAAERFVDRGAYVAAVLQGSEPTPPAASSASSPFSRVLSGVTAGVAAVLVALVALFRAHIPPRVCQVAAWVGQPVLTTLRRLHSGDVGDYVTWIVVGVAVLGGLLALLYE